MGAFLYRAILRLYPRELRAEIGAEMLEGYRLRVARARREQGRLAAADRALRELADLTRNVVPAHLERRDAGKPASDRRSTLVAAAEDTARDLRLGARALVRRPGLSAVVVLTLGLAVAANTVVFAVVDGVVLEPLDYPESDELVLMAESYEGSYRSFSYPNYLDLKERARSLESVGARAGWSFTLTGDGTAEVVSAQLLTPSLMDVLDVRPVLGRGFTERDVAEEAPVVLLSARLWAERYGSDPGVVGRGLVLDGETHTVVGVLPGGLEYPLAGTDLFATFATLSEGERGNRSSHPGISVVGRMRPDADLEAVRADLRSVARTLEADYPEVNRNLGIIVSRLRDFHLGGAEGVLWLLMAAVGLVLLIASGNVASLLLARGAERREEAAVRTALGSGRVGLVRALVSESVVLAGLGGALGTLLAVWGVEAVRRLQPGGLPRLGRVELDGTVLLFALGVAGLAAVLAGVAPALRAARTAPADALREGRRSAGSVRRLRRLLVVGEVALSVVLLLGAGLMIRSVDNLLSTDPGIDPRGVASVYIPLAPAGYPTAEDRARFYGTLLERIEALPGVTAAGGGDPLPLTPNNRQFTISGEGLRRVGDDGLRTDVAMVTPGYFRTMGIDLRAGRGFTGDERPERPQVVIDETLAERLWPGESALGRRLRFRATDSPFMEVVGVVEHVKHYGVATEGRVQLYLPYTVQVRGLSVVARTGGDPAALIPAIRGLVAEMDPDVALVRPTTMEELHRRSIAEQTLARRALELFAGAAFLLAVLGLYGLIAYSVALRSREIGIRMALGARPGRVVRSVSLEGVALAALGVALGLGAAALASRVLAGLLFGVEPTDPATFAVVGLGALALGTAAAALPARRVTRVDPVRVLRAE